jgi:hypothetical protein
MGQIRLVRWREDFMNELPDWNKRTRLELEDISDHEDDDESDILSGGGRR